MWSADIKKQGTVSIRETMDIVRFNNVLKEHGSLDLSATRYTYSEYLDGTIILLKFMDSNENVD